MVEGEGGGSSMSIRRPLDIQLDEFDDELAREEDEVG